MRLTGFVVLVGLFMVGTGCTAVNEDVETSEADVIVWTFREGSAENDNLPRRDATPKVPTTLNPEEG